MKKKLAFFLGISSNLAFAAGNVAIAVNKYYRSEDYDIVIFYSDLEYKDKEALMKIPHVILKQFTLDHSFAKYMLHELPDQCRFKTYDRLMCFSHYEAFGLLERYRYVIWLDADILIQDDISQITNWGSAGFCRDGRRTIADQFVYVPQCKYELEVSAIQIGIMVLEDSIPYGELKRYCYEKSREYAKYSLNPEQAVINLALQEFNLEVNIIPEYIHCDCRDTLAPTTKIVHFGTDIKVWNDRDRYNAFPEWYRNHKKWLALGGTESREYKLDSSIPQNLLETMRMQNENPFFYNEIPQNARVVLYGGGAVGRLYVKQMRKSGYCNIVAVLDKNADKIKYLDDLVMLPQKIKELGNYDYVVIAMEERKKILEVKNILEEFKVPENKIVYRH